LGTSVGVGFPPEVDQSDMPVGRHVPIPDILRNESNATLVKRG
jgi:hypothetical protein